VDADAEPVRLLDVPRSAQGEVQDYQRIRIELEDRMWLSERAVGSMVHMPAELMENAVTFSKPPTPENSGSYSLPTQRTGSGTPSSGAANGRREERSPDTPDAAEDAYADDGIPNAPVLIAVRDPDRDPEPDTPAPRFAPLPRGARLVGLAAELREPRHAPSPDEPAKDSDDSAPHVVSPAEPDRSSATIGAFQRQSRIARTAAEADLHDSAHPAPRAEPTREEDRR
jgi:hypothetical protein